MSAFATLLPSVSVFKCCTVSLSNFLHSKKILLPWKKIENTIKFQVFDGKCNRSTVNDSGWSSQVVCCKLDILLLVLDFSITELFLKTTFFWWLKVLITWVWQVSWSLNFLSQKKNFTFSKRIRIRGK